MTNDDGKTSNKKPLTLSAKTLTLKKNSEGGDVRQSFTHGRSKTVTVEVKKKRVFLPGQQREEEKLSADEKTLSATGLTSQQIEERLKALHGAMKTQALEAERLRQEGLEEKTPQKEIVSSSEEEVAVPESPLTPPFEEGGITAPAE